MGVATSRIFRGCFLFVAALLITGVAVWAQLGTSTIRGTLTDPQGKAIEGATVTLKNAATDYTRTAKTTGAGNFSFELIPVGDYEISIEASGFRTKKLDKTHALVGAPTDLDVQMEIGSATDTVIVEGTGAAVVINTQDATLGNNISTEQINQLPIADHDIRSLLTLQPGVTQNGEVTGARMDQSNTTLDGVDVNEAQTSTLAGTVLRLNGDAIEEFRVNTTNANANQGRSAAAQINLVTKSGTNNFHGDLFEYNRNTIEEANNFFNNRAGVPRTVLNRNTFGGSLGGPILKNKLFFFYSYEGQRTAQAQSVVRIVPLSILGQGQEKVVAAACSTCAAQTFTLTQADLNNIYSSVGLNQAAIQVFAAAAASFPANDKTVGDGINTAGFRFNDPNPTRQNSSIARLDWNITSKQSLFVRWNMIFDNNTNLVYLPGDPTPKVWLHPYGGVIEHTWSLGNNWVNSARYGFTREAFTNIGDTFGNFVNFRFIFQPSNGTFSNSRTTPVQNIVDDVSWIKGNHTVQFGTNIRIVSNGSVNFGGSFDNATTNPSGYQSGGNVVSDPVQAFIAANPVRFGLGATPVLVTPSNVQNVGTALIGRFSQYTGNFNFAHNGSLLPFGSPSQRTFSTQEYDFYLQDAWKITRNVTATYGVRYALARPVYETNGFQVQPTMPLGDYLQQRISFGNAGMNFDVPIVLGLSGPANNGSPMYPWDKNNWQPSVAVAWSPSFESGFLGKIFGGPNKSVIRGGFRVNSDYFGEALAVFFDTNNTLGFSSADVIPVNTYNVTTKPAPLFTAFGQSIRTPAFNKLVIPTGVSFPETQPVDMGERIEASMNSDLKTPKEYTWNLTFERQLPAGITFQMSYVGRLGRNLLAEEDFTAMNDLVDSKSGMDWFTAATVLEKIRQTRPTTATDTSRNKNFAVPTMPYFDDLFPSNLASQMDTFYGFCATSTSRCIPANFTPTQAIFFIAYNLYGNDWTDVQADLDTQRFGAGLPTKFFQSQYGALDGWSSISHSIYHGGSFSIRQRFHKNLAWDFNYTLAHSLDNASGLQSAGSFSGSALILNPIQPFRDYSNSGFDIRHIINVNAVYSFPFGHGQRFGSHVNRVIDGILGGWQISGIYRFNTGLPLSTPIDDARWATNFEVQSNTTQVTNVPVCVDRTTAKLFGCGNTKAAFQSFRNAYPGEVGMRNFLRLPGFNDLDASLLKSFNLSGAHLGENTKLQIRADVFNVANVQHFGAQDLSRTGFGIPQDPAVQNLTPPSNFSNFTGIQGSPRFMQIGARIDF